VTADNAEADISLYWGEKKKIPKCWEQRKKAEGAKKAQGVEVPEERPSIVKSIGG